MKKILLLGASGSLGKQTLQILNQKREDFRLIGFSVGEKIEEIDKILVNFSDVKFIYSKKPIENKKPHIQYFFGEQGLKELVEIADFDMLVNELVGFVGLVPTITALKLNKFVALANKESLVVGGELINNLLREGKGKLYPIDSEHVALAKCLQNTKLEDVDSLVLTASGGALRDFPLDKLSNVTVEQALSHPSWKMGDKITIDSATMMNKGFEIIEAFYLFNFPLNKIEILMHDESKIHSLIKLKDGSFLADIGPSDMRIPIGYALYQGQRNEVIHSSYNISDFSDFHFHKFDEKRYPCVDLALLAIKKGGTLPCVLNAANEEAVKAFLNKKISFIQIDKIIKLLMENHLSHLNPSIEDLIRIDKKTREFAQEIIEHIEEVVDNVRI